MKVSIQNPIDQPKGENRLLEQLRGNLESDQFDAFRFIVAFAKIGPFLRLESVIKEWTNKGKKIEAVFGIDEKGTSFQALEFALKNFTATYIAHFSKHSFSSTFHPKMYIFTGLESGLAYIGSNNFTVGGLETNAESNIKIDFEIAGDEGFAKDIKNSWDSTLEVSRKLDESFLKELLDSGLVIDEREMIGRKLAANRLFKPTIEVKLPSFPLIAVRPPSSIPKTSLVRQTIKKIGDAGRIVEITTQALVIQIIPHVNGEILLSKLAVDQNPDFFGWPFTGKTIPKKATNPSYPQREPDPIVSITLYDSNDQTVFDIPSYSLNTVYYETKSEIRITVPQEVIKNAPPYSIMVINQNAVDEGLDYGIEVFVPGSSSYEKYLAICNQELPSGGKDIPRKFGWV